MKVIKELVAPAAVGELVSRLISFLISRYAKQTCRKEEMFLQLELVALKIHALVDEAERRHLTHNRRLLLWLSKLMDGMYRAYYVLDHRHDGSLLVSSSWSFSLSRSSRPAKRLCTSNAPQPICAADANGVVEELSATLRRLEECAEGMKEFILLLACCPIIPRRPAVSSFQSDDRHMFGRLVEREQIISFLLQPETESSSLGVLPLVGGPEVGKGTIVKHVCSDDRVRRHFAMILYSYGSLLGDNSAEDALGTLRTGGHVLHETSPVVVSGRHGSRHLLVIKNTYEVVINEAAWASLCASLRSAAPGSKVIVVSENDGVADLGTTAAMRVKPLPREEFWYFFRSLSFGVSDPGEHPELAVLGRQIAAALDGSFFGAKVLSSLLRTNLNAQFWGAVLGVVRRFVAELRGDEDHFSKLGVAKLALEILPVPLRLKSAGKTTGVATSEAADTELPGMTVQELLRSATAVPREEVRIVLWESACPPNYRYTVVCEKVETHGPHANIERKRHARQP
ncbi:disease resistance protein RGA2-like [Miscanthus floridulus]|uniref:disease resistance protein RGA2-like n=1 Tax=Miscanthus floridulus TaxID=154761 RepID=UPI00345AA70B